MKTFLFAIILIINASCFAQTTPFANKKKIKADKKEYVVEKLSGIGTGRIIVKGANSHEEEIKRTKYTNDQNNLMDINAPLIKKDFALLNSLLLKSLGKKKLISLPDSSNISIYLIHNSKGNVINVSFALDELTTITPVELEQFENNLTENYKPKIGKPEYLTGFPYFLSANYLSLGKTKKELGLK